MPEHPVKPLIRLVDDEPDQLMSLSLLLEGEGWETASYQSAAAFFAGDTPSRPGCLILDVRMPDVTGLQMQAEMNRREYPLPIIFLTGHGDVDMAVQTMKDGAKDFLQKPVNPERLLTAVAKIVQDDLDQRAMPIDEAEWKKRFERLSSREQDVIRGAIKGLLNKQIALKMQISERTVQAHRNTAYRKLEVHSVADLAPLTVLFSRKVLS
jgi:FixJ family two-component response regulator